MSPTVPPISVMRTSAPESSARERMRSLMAFGDVRDDLDGVAEVVAAALLGDDRSGRSRRS